MKKKIFDLSAASGSACVDIYRDFDEDEIKQKPLSIQKAWEVGRDMYNYLRSLGYENL